MPDAVVAAPLVARLDAIPLDRVVLFAELPDGQVRRSIPITVFPHYDLAPVDGDVEVCGPPPAAWTTKKNGVTYACRVLGLERDRPGCVDRLLARMRATAPGDHHTPGCGLFNKQRHRRPPA